MQFKLIFAQTRFETEAQGNSEVACWDEMSDYEHRHNLTKL